MSFLDHPTVRAAVDAEQETREAAFLGLPLYVEGVALPPLTLRNFLRLRLAGNPFICGGDKFPGDVAAFLYEVTGQTGNRGEYAASIAKLDFVKACEGLIEYKREALFDAGGSAADGDTSSRSYWSEPASLCDIMGREYGWTVDQTMGAPVAVLVQLMRIINRREDPKRPLFNRLSDRALLEVAPNV